MGDSSLESQVELTERSERGVRPIIGRIEKRIFQLEGNRTGVLFLLENKQKNQ